MKIEAGLVEAEAHLATVPNGTVESRDALSAVGHLERVVFGGEQLPRNVNLRGGPWTMAVRASTEERGRRAGLAALRSTLDGAFWLVAVLATAGSLLVLGLPTAVIPNPFFIRMTPTEAFNVVVRLASAPLIGLLIATHVRPPRHTLGHESREPGAGRATLGGLAAYIAIGCPICNKVVVAALGVSGALSYFAPLQPIIGAGSVALLGATLVWRLRDRAGRCERCVA